MNRRLYSLLFYLAMPLVLLRLLLRSLKAPAYRRRWPERLALYGESVSQPVADSVVFHAVSVGEVHAAVPLIRAWQSLHPEQPVVITCSTPTGSARVEALFGDSVIHVYLPYDLPGAIQRFLDRFRPRLLVMLETELWPNLIHHCRRRGIAMLLANARLSARSRHGYRRVARIAREMLSGVDAVAAQSDADAQRLCSLGLAPSRVTVTGSLKFDIQPDERQRRDGQALRQRCYGERPVLIAASTREGEDEKVLNAFRMMKAENPSLALVLVPRHPERFASAAALFEQAGYRVFRRSRLSAEGPLADMDVLVGDTMGEMPLYYAMADIAFVGGSLVDTGCQNILEPAALGLPVITGPSLFNFQSVSDVLCEAGGQLVVPDEQALARAVLSLLAAPARRRSMGRAASDMVERSTGATDRVLSIMSRLAAGEAGQRGAG